MCYCRYYIRHKWISGLSEKTEAAQISGLSEKRKLSNNNDHDKDMNPAVSDYDAASQVSNVPEHDYGKDNIIEQKMQRI